MGSYLLNITISDTLISNTYTFNVIVTNNPPGFSTTITTNISLVVNQVANFTLPSYSDPDGNALSLTTFQSGGLLSLPLPGFIIFTLSNNSYSFMPLTISDVGSFIIDAKICDGEPLCTTFSFTVNVISNSIPPPTPPTPPPTTPTLVMISLKDQILTQGDTLTYSIPQSYTALDTITAV